MKKRNLLIKVLILAFVSLSVINMPFNVMASSTGAVLSSTVESEVSILGEGTSGDITWKVDSNGVLWLKGNGHGWSLGNIPWYAYTEDITSAVVDISGITNAAFMFSGCSNLTSLDLSNFDTSNVTDMWGMFSGCTNLTSLDLSNFDTSNVTDMSVMFSGCSNLTSLDLSNFDTSNVTDMSGMFSGCSNLTSLDLSNFDTSKVTYMGYNCNINNDVVPAGMFTDCSNLTSLNLSSFDTSNVRYMKAMFSGCTNLTSLDLSNFDTSNVTDMSVMFSGCSNLTSLDLSNFDTSNVTDMSVMFSGCSSLTNLDVSNFDTSKVIFMQSIFAYCSSLTSLDVSSFDISNVSDSYSIFWYSNLTKLHTPINVTTFVELPSSDNETWYMDTTEITHLPQNLDYSVTLVKKTALTSENPNDPEIPNKVLIEAITISPSDISLKTGEKRTLSKSCTPSNASRQSVSWHSTDSDIASIDNQGTVTGVSEGTAEIYCVSQDGGSIESNRCTVEVTSNTDIITTEIPKAMKYVPYSYRIQSTKQLSRNSSSYWITSGSLPEGMNLKSDGELYGVPEQTGTFTFTVEMDNNDSNNTLFSSEQTFTLQVIENTNANIETMTDPGYELTERVPNLTLDTLTDQTMVSKGDYEEFVNLFLDGVKLEREVDYTAEPGSTRITIKSQTLKRFNTPGTHTLAMEFRTKNTNTLRWAAQNYVISGNGTNNGNTSNNKVSLRGRSSRRASSGSQPAAVSDIIYDSKKGYVHIVTGIITGEGTGYSCWIQDETDWKLNYADRTLARGSIRQLEDGATIEQILWELINGSWYAFGADGSVKDGWVYDYQLGSWYCTSAESGMKVSWHTDLQDGHTYYLEPESGKLAKGWKQINNQWYYFNADTTSQAWRFDETTGNWSYNTNNKEKPFGAMYSNENTPDGYYVNGDGIWDGK